MYLIIFFTPPNTQFPTYIPIHDHSYVHTHARARARAHTHTHTHKSRGIRQRGWKTQTYI